MRLNNYFLQLCSCLYQSIHPVTSRPGCSERLHQRPLQESHTRGPVDSDISKDDGGAVRRFVCTWAKMLNCSRRDLPRSWPQTTPRMFQVVTYVSPILSCSEDHDGSVHGYHSHSIARLLFQLGRVPAELVVGAIGTVTRACSAAPPCSLAHLQLSFPDRFYYDANF